MNIEKILKEQNIEELEYAIEKGLDVSTIKFIKFINKNEEINYNFWDILILKNKIYKEYFYYYAVKSINRMDTLNMDFSLLMLVSFIGDIELIKKILKDGNDINQKNNLGWSPLIFAIFSERIKVIKVLLEKGADMNFATKEGETPLSISLYTRHFDISKILIENGINLNQKIKVKEEHYFEETHQYMMIEVEDTPLFLAMKNESVEIVQLLIKYGENINLLNGKDKEYFLANTSLLEMAKLLIHYGVKTKNIMTLSLDVAKLLIENGGQIDKDTILHETLHKPLKLFEYFMSLGANLDDINDYCTGWKNFKGTLLMKTIKESNVSLYYQPNIKTIPLKILRENNIKIAKLLLKNNANINLKEPKTGNTALMIAVLDGKEEFVNLLIKNNANLNIKNNDGNTALILSVLEKKEDFSKILIDKGAKIDIKNNEGLIVFHFARGKIREKLLEKIDINYKIDNKDKESEKILNKYLYERMPLKLKIEDVKKAIISATDIDTTDNFQWSILMEFGESIDTLKINNQYHNGETLLMLACEIGNKGFISFLLEEGADVTIQDNKGDKAEMYARYSESPKEIIELLREYENKLIPHQPKKLINLLTNFTIDTPIKYSTHLWDFSSLKEEYTDFKGFINEIDKQWRVIGEELKELSPKLHEKIYNFLLNDNPTKSWCSKADISVGWSSLDGLEEWCNEGRNPFDFELKESIGGDNQIITTFGEVITLFKKEIEIRNDSNMLENIFLAQKRKLGRAFKMELIKLKGRSFYTDVESFQNAIERLFQEIQKRKEHKEIKVEVVEPDAQSIEIVITQIGSRANRDIKEMVDEVEDGDFKMLKESLTNLCDWSIESDSESGGYRVNYLSESTQEKSKKLLDALDGFKHILRFYKK